MYIIQGTRVVARELFSVYAQDMVTPFQEGVSLKTYTVFKIGGPARFFVETKSKEACMHALHFAKERQLPFLILGAGSNVLVSDKGFDGLVIKNSGNAVSIEGGQMLAESGAMMGYSASVAARAGYAGFEWGIGVPGTIGGSVRGNAGCFGREMKDVIASVEVFDAARSTSYKIQATHCEFGYRDSVFKQSPHLVVLSAVLRLREEGENLVQNRMRELVRKRAATQDIGAKCAGCIFKNVSWDRKDISKEFLLDRFPALRVFQPHAGISAGFLIDEVGLKGRSIGGATISRKHANFFINEGNASAEDVIMLIAVAKEYVHRKFGILLEEEIQYAGF